MIAHVAEASEASGRVVLWLSPASPVSSAAMAAATRVAVAYGSEVETVVISRGELPADGAVPVRRIGVSRTQTDAAAEAGSVIGLCVGRHQRELERAAQRAGIGFRHTLAEGDPFDRLAEMCQARGPWNIVALSEPPSASLGHTVSTILANVAGATAVIAAPAMPRSAGDKVVVAIEDMDRMPSMLRAAERLCSIRGTIHVLIAEQTRMAFDELETAVRLLTEGRRNVVFEPTFPTFAVEGALDGMLRQTMPGFVIARFGGALFPTGRSLSRTISLAGAPFLLVR